ncbi:hypothetical protein IJG12_01700 [Candidatus Saccharibacteria bacterium]|nr:hypothetical protein [Candidatus Saccharibacteria bacterium]
MKKRQEGQIIIAKGVKNILPWEMHSAIALKEIGYTITFLPSHNSIHSADAYLDNTLFEFKSPEGTTIKCIENNLQKALRNQSNNIVIDTSRVKYLKDRSIKSYLISRMKRKHGINKLILITKNREVVDINKDV